MAAAADPPGPHPTIDLYDEEFNRNLLLAKNLMKKLKKIKDREICSKWITRLCAMKSTDPSVKKNRNQFFKYMLTVIHRGVDESIVAHHGYPQYDNKFGAVGDDPQGKPFMSKWSGDNRTYVAIKPLPGQGALVYMAVAKDPNFGWEYSKK